MIRAPEPGELILVPLVTKIGGIVWLPVSIGLWQWFQRVLGIDEQLRRRAEGIVEGGLWNVNQWLFPKVRLAQTSDYVQSADDAMQLKRIVQSCMLPLDLCSTCDLHADRAKVTAFVHAGLFFVWGGLVLFTDLNAPAVFWGLFFFPILVATLFATCSIRNRFRLRRMERMGSDR